MRKLLLIAALAATALYAGAGSALARPLAADDASEASGKKRRDGGTRDEEREEDVRRGAPVPRALGDAF